MDIFVGSLPFKLKEAELSKLFEQYGEVSSVRIVINNITRQNKGFGFVTMENNEEALKAIESLNGALVMERAIVVNEATSKLGDKANAKSNKQVKNNYNRKPTGGYSRKFGK